MSINLNLQRQILRTPSGFFTSNRKRLLDAFRVNSPSSNSCIFFKGGVQQRNHDDDCEQVAFTQENNFWYCFGIELPELYGVIEVDTGKATVFCPPITAHDRVWEYVQDFNEIKDAYEVDDAIENNAEQKNMQDWFSSRNFAAIHILDGCNPYSGKGPTAPDMGWLKNHMVNKQILYDTINEVRIRKTEDELVMLRQVGELGSEAHCFVMQNMKPGMSEAHIQSLFRFYNSYYMQSLVPYGEICAAHKNGAILHYINNDATVQDGEMLLFDGGARVNHFCSDITTTWPVNGKFTEKQAAWYNIVLKANRAVFAMVKPGVHWQDCHIMAEKTILQGLIDLGILQGGTMEEMWEDRVSYYFMPHGLGHYIGIYTHDFKGDKRLEDIKKPIPKQSLRVYRVLEEGMCLTNEPGCYVIRGLLKEAKEDEKIAKYFNFDLIEEYAKEVMATRIEDNFVVTKDGHERYTNLPRTTQAIEACIRGEDWKHLN